MKKIILLSTIYFLITSCVNDENVAQLENSSKIKLNVSKKTIDNFYNLQWNSPFLDKQVTYDLLLNNSILKNNITKTVIDEVENTIEFNIPATEFSLDTSNLKKGKNTLALAVKFQNSNKTIVSSPITIIN